MTGRFARSNKGERAYIPNSLTKGTRVSTIGALGSHGILTAMCFEGTLTVHVFEFFVRQFLFPLLQPGKVGVMDNASTHKDLEIIELIESTGVQILFLPPYSPELNPIELIWAKVKNSLKKATITSLEKLYEAIAQALETITSTDAQNCFEHCLK